MNNLDYLTLWPHALTTLKRVNRALSAYTCLDTDDGLVIAKSDLLYAMRRNDVDDLRTATRQANVVLWQDAQLTAAIVRLDGAAWRWKGAA